MFAIGKIIKTLDMRHNLLMICVIFSTFLSAQEVLQPEVNDIGIVEFFRKGHKLSLPVINIYEKDVVELRFDVFGTEENILYYSIELCDYNWQPVELDPLDYIEGFTSNHFYAYSASMNTLFDYVHYRLEIPNDDMSFILPGNYLIHIFNDDNLKSEILTKKFVVYKEQVKLDVWVDKFESAIYEDRQEIKAKITPSEVSLNDLSGNIKLSVLQNNNWNSVKYYDKYNTEGDGGIAFNTTGQIVFPGVNEFRFFDMKSLKFISERVEYFEYKPPHYHVYLKPDYYRGDKQYFNNQDLNGQFFISNQETRDPDTLDAEYAFVYFTLDAGVPLPADVYIEGALTNWEFKDNFMKYNPDKAVYEKVLFLKQGLYNYRYTTKEYNTDFMSWDITEGSFYQTNNSYLGIVYYRPLGEIYYQPVGVGVSF